MKEKLLKNKKLIAGIIAGLIVIVIAIIVVLILNKPKLVLKDKEMNVEFGNAISLKTADYLDKDKVDQEVISKTEVVTDAPDTTTLYDGNVKNCPPIGEYTVTLSYEDETAKVKVNVKDTTKPSFDKFEDSIEITKDCKPVGDELSKLLEKYTAKDLQKVTVTWDDSKVDYSKEGEYKATVKAKDETGNEATKETTIKIVKPTIKLDNKSKSMYVKENFVLKATINGKDNKAMFKSSDSSIASVDANGKVSAKKKGNATITATANGVSTECKVTVKSIPSGSNTEKKTVTNPNTGKKEEVIVVKPSTPSSSGGTSSSSDNISQNVTISREAFNLINAERRKLGLQEAVWDSECERIALIRAKQLTTDFSHDKFYTDFQSNNRRLGEVATKLGSNNNASHAVTNWMNSTSHKNIIMADNYTKIVIF